MSGYALIMQEVSLVNLIFTVVSFALFLYCARLFIRFCVTQPEKAIEKPANPYRSGLIRIVVGTAGVLLCIFNPWQ
jgi:hypothetical protein